MTLSFILVTRQQHILDDYHLPEDDNHHSHRRGNLKSYNIYLVFFVFAFRPASFLVSVRATVFFLYTFALIQSYFSCCLDWPQSYCGW
jgi:hypothetical protein